jgi:hypothetical protein
MSAYYFDKVENHNKTPTEEIVGKLVKSYEHIDLKRDQSKAWYTAISLVKSVLTNNPTLNNWSILYEYKIPRRSKKVDIVLLSKRVIYVIEVKVGKSKFNSTDVRQLEDYCLDIRDFHSASRGQFIVPILWCTEASIELNYSNSTVDTFLQKTEFVTTDTLLDKIIFYDSALPFDSNLCKHSDWNDAEYVPTPTIIEAAQSLYAGQDVKEITQSHSGVENLSKTTESVLKAIKTAQNRNEKIICFITGVPGAGKTLAGLNIVHNREFKKSGDDIGVFLSGNGPLVKVLQEALARDFSKKNGINKKEALRRVTTFVHNVHQYIDAYYTAEDTLPADRILIYDEAQRAWSKEQKIRKSYGKITESEPEILMSILNRLDGWCALIALIGGGQEINDGEAGLREWGRTIEEKFPSWKTYISPSLVTDNHSIPGNRLFECIPENISVNQEEDLHLKVSLRSYKAKKLNEWVTQILSNRPLLACEILNQDLSNYPIALTRNLDTVRTWLNEKEKGTNRTGIITSSGARRLRALGIDPYYGLRGDSSHSELGAWYLNSPEDVRSSNFLEIVSTEYAIQGLEIDWAGLIWGADFRYVDGNWEYGQFRGTKWQNVNSDQKRKYILNKYRVLLTRARQGIIICIPNGSNNDQTRPNYFYDGTYTYLKECGLKEI